MIRSLFLELHYDYGVAEVIGFRGGYSGLDPAFGFEPVKITPQFVDCIHQQGGTVLSSSRGPVDVGVAVDNLIKRGVNILFTVGGDGTSGARMIFTRKRRGAAIRSRSWAFRKRSTTMSVSSPARLDFSVRLKNRSAFWNVRTPKPAAFRVALAW